MAAKLAVESLTSRAPDSWRSEAGAPAGGAGGVMGQEAAAGGVAQGAGSTRGRGRGRRGRGQVGGAGFISYSQRLEYLLDGIVFAHEYTNIEVLVPGEERGGG